MESKVDDSELVKLRQLIFDCALKDDFDRIENDILTTVTRYTIEYKQFKYDVDSFR
jgi:hypothetical protein